MGTKTEEETAREAFKQELLHTSNWGLRRLAVGPKGAGIEIADMRKADEKGPEAVVELIMEKYDEGWRPGGAALNAQSKSATTRTPEKKEDGGEDKEEEPKDDTPPEEDGNPWDDIGTDDGDLDLNGDSSDSEPDPEPDPEPEPEKPKRQRRTPAKDAAAGEMSALEEKLDKILDTMMKFASVVSKFEKTASSIESELQKTHLAVVEVKEVATVALGGLFNRLSIADYTKVVDRAKAVAKKACGIKD